ncbi:MAG: PqiA/YebS family transporter subunit [Desulforhopalus sp.]
MYQITETLDKLTACPDCDLLLPYPQLPDNHSFSCPRCGKTIQKKSSGSIVKTQALSIAGLLIYPPAMLLPLMTFKSFGFSGSANVLETIINFYVSGYYFVAVMVLLSAVIFPLVLLGCLLIITTMMRRHRSPRYLRSLFRAYLHLEEWAMVEVYLLGIMITIIKMHNSSDIVYHSGFFCFFILVLITLSTATVLDKHLFWQRIAGDIPQGRDMPVAVPSGTGAERNLILCHICQKLSPSSLEGQGCPRCGEPLHLRAPGAVGRTWALIITGAIFLAPANLLPIMQIDFLGIPDRSTILDGIIHFFQNGSYFIGLIIFTASVLVPVFKIVGLSILLLARRPCNPALLRQKAKMYRFIAFIGRWSMLDIFVIALLTVLVDYGFFTSIHAAPAATYFCIVVAATMFAAITYDPRIMWDNCSPSGKTAHPSSRNES